MRRNLFIGFLIGFGLATAIVPLFTKLKPEEGDKSQASNSYPFLARRIFADNPNDLIINFTQLRNQVKDYINTQDVRIGFYFEYLPTGLSIGVKEQEAFYRASLVKLPIVMKAYKLIEEGKIDKDEVLKITKDDIDQGYGDLWKEGRSEITLSEAINLALTKSDNTAFRVINSRVDRELTVSGNEIEKAITEIYNYLDIPLDSRGYTESITPKGYGSIFKSLFFSAYLNYDNSSEVLNQLSHSIFRDWMPKSIPENVVVAHKTGTFDLEKSIYSVHSDCGIVYYPNRPYLICIMVNSNDLDISLKHINYLSELVFNYIDDINAK